MKKYLIFDLDGTLIQSNNKIDTIVYKYISEKIDPELLDTARYIIENNQGMSLKEIFTHLLEKTETSKAIALHYKNVTKLINKISSEVVFFPGVPEKIIELSKKYTLFLSTGNSDDFANQMLQQGEIHECFNKILGSTFIPKSPQHIDQFIEYTGDDNLPQDAIFIGDGDYDRVIAKSKNIDFIHIGNIGKDIYEIETVKNIDIILSQINK